MNKELEELLEELTLYTSLDKCYIDKIKKIARSELGKYDISTLVPTNKTLVERVTPPTADEVCKALSEYWGISFRYKSENNRFIQYLGSGEWKIFNLLTLTNEAPHIITMIGRFYEGVIE